MYKLSTKRTYNRIFYIIFTFYLISVILFPPRSTEPHIISQDKVYIDSIRVKSGDTLWKIAKTYYPETSFDIYEHIEQIKKCNGLVDDTIKAGSTLVIPYRKSTLIP